MKKWMIIPVALLLLFGGVYFGSPYYAVNSLRNAALEADTDKLETSVDFPSVRESLKSQLSASLMTHMQNDPKMQNNPFAGLGALMVPAIVDRAVDSFVTPNGIAALIRGQKPNQTAEVKENPDIESSSEYLSADRFRVRLRNTKLNEDGPSLLLERRGFASWKLIKVGLPANLLGPQSDGSASARTAPAETGKQDPETKDSMIAKASPAEPVQEKARASQPTTPQRSPPLFFAADGSRDSRALGYVKSGMASEITFAEHFSVSEVACGTGCSSFYFVDRRTGAVVEAPNEASDGWSVWDVATRASSEVATVTYSPIGGTGQECSRQSFRWNGSRFASISAIRMTPCPW